MAVKKRARMKPQKHQYGQLLAADLSPRVGSFLGASS
jgi:hypothetical protein